MCAHKHIHKNDSFTFNSFLTEEIGFRNVTFGQAPYLRAQMTPKAKTFAHAGCLSKAACVNTFLFSGPSHGKGLAASAAFPVEEHSTYLHVLVPCFNSMGSSRLLNSEIKISTSLECVV